MLHKRRRKGLTGRRIGIIGAGAGGIGAAVKLVDAGFDGITILEQAAGVGGTWWHNRYPGLTCDIKSHLYSYSFAPKLDWRRPYGTGDEIRAYLEEVVEQWGLKKFMALNTKVVDASWDDHRNEWTVTAASGEVFVFDVIIPSVGMFNQISWPAIEGMSSFAGTAFHSARWDTDHRLDGERIGVVGSAASAVQLIPEVARVAEQLFVFQRSPNWVLPKEDVAWTPEQLADFRASPELVAQLRTEIFEHTDRTITFSDPNALALATQAGLNAIGAVDDVDVRRMLTPQHPFGCKRPLISNDYFSTFNRDNVELVTEPIHRVTPRGVVTADGVERTIDTLIFATGFKTTSFASAIETRGQDGLRLSDRWSKGAHAYLGIATSGFPNMFMLYGPNTNNGSIIYMLECQADYVVGVLEWMETEHLNWVSVKPSKEAIYNERLQRDLDGIGVWSAGGCHNYYRGPSGRIETQWPHSMSEYRHRTHTPDPDDFLTSAF
jgi:cation diffusion facilitator CzcD-associated flavoprotein CzcO